MSNLVTICSYCRRCLNTKQDGVDDPLTDAEYKELYLSGAVSHGCCNGCLDRLSLRPHKQHRGPQDSRSCEG